MTLPKNPDRRQASNVVPLHPMLAEAQELIALGLDVIPLEPCSKITLVTGWTTAAPHTAESFAAALKPGGNIGLRTGRPVPGGGYLHVVDFDADAPTPEALAELHKLVPQAVLHRCPTVISGNASALLALLRDRRRTAHQGHPQRPVGQDRAAGARPASCAASEQSSRVGPRLSLGDQPHRHGRAIRRPHRPDYLGRELPSVGRPEGGGRPAKRPPIYRVAARRICR